MDGESVENVDKILYVLQILCRHEGLLRAIDLARRCMAYEHGQQVFIHRVDLKLPYISFKRKSMCDLVGVTRMRFIR
jgi:hypothetical protein